MNTNMTGFRLLSKNFACLCAFDINSLSIGRVNLMKVRLLSPAHHSWFSRLSIDESRAGERKKETAQLGRALALRDKKEIPTAFIRRVFRILTLPMLRLLSSKAKDFLKPSKPGHVGIH